MAQVYPGSHPRHQCLQRVLAPLCIMRQLLSITQPTTHPTTRPTTLPSIQVANQQYSPLKFLHHSLQRSHLSHPHHYHRGNPCPLPPRSRASSPRLRFRQLIHRSNRVNSPLVSHLHVRPLSPPCSPPPLRSRVSSHQRVQRTEFLATPHRAQRLRTQYNCSHQQALLTQKMMIKR